MILNHLKKRKFYDLGSFESSDRFGALFQAKHFIWGKERERGRESGAVTHNHI